MNSADGWGDDVYQPDGSEVQDDAGLLDAEDTLENDGVADPLDRGWSPPERPLGGGALRRDGGRAPRGRDAGPAARRGAAGPPPPGRRRHSGIPTGHGRGTPGQRGRAARSGRLVAPDEGAHEDEEEALVATDVGIDGAAASAEEAAVHIVDEDSPARLSPRLPRRSAGPSARGAFMQQDKHPDYRPVVFRDRPPATPSSHGPPRPATGPSSGTTARPTRWWTWRSPRRATRSTRARPARSTRRAAWPASSAGTAARAPAEARRAASPQIDVERRRAAHARPAA